MSTRVTAGGIALAPAGLPHAFMVLSDQARVLCLHTPGTCEAFYLGASDHLDPGESRGAVDPSRIAASAAAHGGIELLGPPPFTARLNAGALTSSG